MRIGVFGGTFNPIHLGHLISVEHVRNECSLDRVILMPARVPVHKEMPRGATAEERLRMVTLAAAGVDWLQVSRMEIDRETPSYTINTVNALMREYAGSQLYLIIGGDSFNEISTWKSYRELVGMVSLIVMKRRDAAGFPADVMDLCREVIFAGNPVIEISSTMIREKIRAGLGAGFLTPPAVADYINGKGLYRN